MAKEKELETARLRAKQERAADRQAEIDELRARRSPFLPASHSLATLLSLAIRKSLHPFERSGTFQYTHRHANDTECKELNID